MFPKQESKPKISNLDVLNTFLYIVRKWRSIGKNWHTIYIRANNWAKNGVLEKFLLMGKAY